MATLPLWVVRLNPLHRPTFLERVFRPAMESGPVILTQNRLYILPTRHGLLFALMLLVMLLGAINYANSMAFVLTFLLGGLGVVSILHTYRNLARLSVSAGRNEPVFAGQEARFQVCLDNPTSFARHAIALSAAKEPVAIHVDIAPWHAAHLEFNRRAEHRGRLAAGRFTLVTTYPLGLLRAWTHLNLDMTSLVYPRPAAEGLPPPLTPTETGQGKPQGEGQEDFSGLRGYRSGDSLRQVAWKAVARGQGMLIKQFSGEAQQELWLDFAALPDLDTEEKLSRLTRWVLDADAANQRYGLRLPGKALEPAAGPEQRRLCLEALALFGLET